MKPLLKSRLQRLYYGRGLDLQSWGGWLWLRFQPRLSAGQIKRSQIIGVTALYVTAIVVGEQISLDLKSAALALAIVTVAALAQWWWRRYLGGFIRAALVFCLGLAWFCQQVPPSPSEFCLGRSGELQGVILSVYDHQVQRTRVVVRLENAVFSGQGPSGISCDFTGGLGTKPRKALVSIYHTGKLQAQASAIRDTLVPGRKIRFEAALQLPISSGNIGLFDYRAYLRRRGIVYTANTDLGKVSCEGLRGMVISRAVHRLRTALTYALDSWLTQPEGAVVKGMILGDKKDIPPDTRQVMEAAGISHLLAVSGLHIGLVSALVFQGIHRLRLGQSAAAACAALAAIVFAFVTGWSLSAARACLAVLCGLLVARRDRHVDPAAVTCVTAMAILIWRPLVLFDVSFQLSYSAVVGILLLAPRWNDVIRLPKVGPALSVSLAAGMGTLPTAAWHFFAVPMLAPIANLVAVPLAGLILPLGLTGLTLWLIWPPVAAPLAVAVRWLVRGLTVVAQAIAKVPGAYAVVGQPNAAAVMVYLVGIALVVRCLDQRQFMDPSRRRKVFATAMVGATGLLVWTPLLTPPRPICRVTSVDVGQGDCFLVQERRGLVALIDGGGSDPRYSDFDIGSAITLPYLHRQGIVTLDAVVSTHPHRDHIGGLLTVMQAARCKVLIDNGDSTAADSGQRLRELGAAGGSHLLPLENSRSVVLSTGLTELTTWQPQATTGVGVNDQSLATKITSGAWSVLLTADLETAGLQALLSDSGVDLRADVLQIPHHGAYGPRLSSLLQRVRPKACLISVGRNSFGHPTSETLQLLEQAGMPVFRTDLDGEVRVEVHSDQRLVIRTGRGRTMVLAK